MYRTSISLTDSQRERIEKLQVKWGFRSVSATVARLIDLEFETKTAYQEQKLQTAGAQNPERETKQKTGGTICLK